MVQISLFENPENSLCFLRGIGTPTQARVFFYVFTAFLPKNEAVSASRSDGDFVSMNPGFVEEIFFKKIVFSDESRIDFQNGAFCLVWPTDPNLYPPLGIENVVVTDELVIIDSTV